MSFLARKVFFLVFSETKFGQHFDFTKMTFLNLKSIAETKKIQDFQAANAHFKNF